jgi:hypothetical protein
LVVADLQMIFEILSQPRCLRILHCG